MGLSGSKDYGLKSILNKYYINFSTPSLSADKTRSLPANTVMTRTLILDQLEMKRKW